MYWSTVNSLLVILILLPIICQSATSSTKKNGITSSPDHSLSHRTSFTQFLSTSTRPSSSELPDAVSEMSHFESRPSTTKRTLLPTTFRPGKPFVYIPTTTVKSNSLKSESQSRNAKLLLTQSGKSNYDNDSSHSSFIFVKTFPKHHQEPSSTERRKPSSTSTTEAPSLLSFVQSRKILRAKQSGDKRHIIVSVSDSSKRPVHEVFDGLIFERRRKPHTDHNTFLRPPLLSDIPEKPTPTTTRPSTSRPPSLSPNSHLVGGHGRGYLPGQTSFGFSDNLSQKSKNISRSTPDNKNEVLDGRILYWYTSQNPKQDIGEITANVVSSTPAIPAVTRGTVMVIRKRKRKKSQTRVLSIDDDTLNRGTETTRRRRKHPKRQGTNHEFNEHLIKTSDRGTSSGVQEKPVFAETVFAQFRPSEHITKDNTFLPASSDIDLIHAKQVHTRVRTAPPVPPPTFPDVTLQEDHEISSIFKQMEFEAKKQSISLPETKSMVLSLADEPLTVSSTTKRPLPPTRRFKPGGRFTNIRFDFPDFTDRFSEVRTGHDRSTLKTHAVVLPQVSTEVIDPNRGVTRPPSHEIMETVMIENRGEGTLISPRPEIIQEISDQKQMDFNRKVPEQEFEKEMIPVPLPVEIPKLPPPPSREQFNTPPSNSDFQGSALDPDDFLRVSSQQARPQVPIVSVDTQSPRPIQVAEPQVVEQRHGSIYNRWPARQTDVGLTPRKVSNSEHYPVHVSLSQQAVSPSRYQQWSSQAVVLPPCFYEKQPYPVPEKYKIQEDKPKYHEGYEEPAVDYQPYMDFEPQKKIAPPGTEISKEEYTSYHQDENYSKQKQYSSGQSYQSKSITLSDIYGSKSPKPWSLAYLVEDYYDKPSPPYAPLKDYNSGGPTMKSYEGDSRYHAFHQYHYQPLKRRKPYTAAPSYAPTTYPSTTYAPTTYPPTTYAPTTYPPTTKPPTTQAPTTEAPITDAPTTDAPTTEAPITQPPTAATESAALQEVETTTTTTTTYAPTTTYYYPQKVTAQNYYTPAVYYSSSTTEATTTTAKTTNAPTTEAPVTDAPTTKAPTTEAVTTEAVPSVPPLVQQFAALAVTETEKTTEPTTTTTTATTTTAATTTSTTAAPYLYGQSFSEYEPPVLDYGQSPTPPTKLAVTPLQKINAPSTGTEFGTTTAKTVEPTTTYPYYYAPSPPVAPQRTGEGDSRYHAFHQFLYEPRPKTYSQTSYQAPTTKQVNIPVYEQGKIIMNTQSLSSSNGFPQIHDSASPLDQSQPAKLVSPSLLQPTTSVTVSHAVVASLPPSSLDRLTVTVPSPVAAALVSNLPPTYYPQTPMVNIPVFDQGQSSIQNPSQIIPQPQQFSQRLVGPQNNGQFGQTNPIFTENFGNINNNNQNMWEPMRVQINPFQNNIPNEGNPLVTGTAATPTVSFGYQNQYGNLVQTTTYPQQQSNQQNLQMNYNRPSPQPYQSNQGDPRTYQASVQLMQHNHDGQQQQQSNYQPPVNYQQSEYQQPNYNQQTEGQSNYGSQVNYTPPQYQYVARFHEDCSKCDDSEDETPTSGY